MSQAFEYPSRIDRVKGMLFGVALGDSLGVPHEFTRATPKLKYTGLLQDTEVSIRFQFASLVFPANSTSDDTQMTVALLRALRENNFHYNTNNVIKHYMNWANIASSLGTNTRKLFKGVKTANGYLKRFVKLTPNDKVNMQSNGTLMRLSPLILIQDKQERDTAIKIDTYLSNPNQVNLRVNIFSIDLLCLIFENTTHTELIDWIKSEQIRFSTISKESTDEEERTAYLLISQVISDAIDGADRNVTNKDKKNKKKGWVLSSLFVALLAFIRCKTFQDTINMAINIPGSDTDTNGAITGMFTGAFFGFTHMKSEHDTNINLKKLISFFNESDMKYYGLKDIDYLINIDEIEDGEEIYLE